MHGANKRIWATAPKPVTPTLQEWQLVGRSRFYELRMLLESQRAGDQLEPLVSWADQNCSIIFYCYIVTQSLTLPYLNNQRWIVSAIHTQSYTIHQTICMYVLDGKSE